MANVRGSNSLFVDTSSSSGDSTSFLADKNLKLIGVIYFMTSATDILDIYDKDPSTNAAGPHKLSVMSSTAKNSTQLRLADAPIVFPNGVWFTLTGAPKATLIFTQSAG